MTAPLTAMPRPAPAKQIAREAADRAPAPARAAEAVGGGQRAGPGQAPVEFGAHGRDEQTVGEAGEPERGGGAQGQPDRRPPAGVGGGSVTTDLQLPRPAARPGAPCAVRTARPCSARPASRR
jgi:hypothetical protein